MKNYNASNSYILTTSQNTVNKFSYEAVYRTSYRTSYGGFNVI